MRLTQFKITKICKTHDDDGYEYTDVEVRDLLHDEVCFLDDVLLPKTKRQLVEMSDFAARLED
jgi:hypothetical protein